MVVKRTSLLYIQVKTTVKGFYDALTHLDKKIIWCKELGTGLFIGGDNIVPPLTYRLNNVSLKAQIKFCFRGNCNRRFM